MPTNTEQTTTFLIKERIILKGTTQACETYYATSRSGSGFGFPVFLAKRFKTEKTAQRRLAQLKKLSYAEYQVVVVIG